MIWRLFNFIFGWDYVVWQNSADRGIARVQVDSSGKIYYWRYKNTNLADIIHSEKDVKLWLTCKPSKYGFKDE